MQSPDSICGIRFAKIALERADFFVRAIGLIEFCEKLCEAFHAGRPSPSNCVESACASQPFSHSQRTIGAV
jgi:hypothetical protein